MSNGTPSQFDFRMPAEWDLHEATWMTWPHNSETWPGQDMNLVKTAYVQMIQALSEGEMIHLLVNDEDSENEVVEILNAAKIPEEKIKFFRIPTNDSWVRDYGPNFLTRDTETGGSEIAANLWQFDSWGKKYEFDLDGLAAGKIAETLKVRCFEPGIVLEGGAIEVNGRGTCITTRNCLLNSNRNDGLSQEDMETLLNNYLGTSNIIWCKGEIEGDDTDGHIDNLVRFANPTSVLCVICDDESDPNHACMQENLRILESSFTEKGKPLKVIPLPSPGRLGDDKTRLPASYANFYIGNQTVLVPTFNDPNDQTALDAIARAFPDKSISPIDCTVLLWGLGGPHCLTQQQPIEFDF